jgi:hypothetical protein
MSRQVPHVEDIATGTPTAGLVPVSAGAGLAPAWGAAGGGGGGGGGSAPVYEEFAPPSTGNFFMPANCPMKRVLMVAINSNVQSMANLADIYIAEGPFVTANILSGGSIVGLLYEAGKSTDRGLVYSEPGDGKCLSLWNGSSNDAPPVGWETVGFSDGAWTAPGLAQDSGGSPVGDFVPGGRSVWPTVHGAAHLEKALFRHTFTLTSGQITAAIKAQVRVFVDDFILDVFVNGNVVNPNSGMTLNGQGPMLGFYVPLSWLVAGTNVLAFQGQDGTDGSPPEAHISYRFDLD